MALTVSRNNLRDVHVGQNGFREQNGILAFTTTSLTGELPSSIDPIEEINVTPIGPPGTCTREVFVPLGTVSATTAFNVITPPYAGSLVSAKLVVTTAITRDDTNFWAFTLVNKGTDGTGTNDMVITATDVNKTKLTFLNLAAATVTDLTVHGTAANLAFSASSALLFTATKTASGANLVAAGLILNFNVGDLGEYVYVDEAAQVTSGLMARPATKTLTVTRGGPTVTSALQVGYRFRGR